MDFNNTSSSRTSNGESELTDHAEGCFERSAPLLVLHHIYDAGRPLFNELNSKAYTAVERLVKKTFPTCSVSQIHLVNAPQMYGMYMLRKEEMKLAVGRSVQDKLLFHVTTESRAMESLDSGLDWRRTQRNKFGRGVSFSDDADYANYYADNSSSEETRVIMICCVAIGEKYVVPRQSDGNSLTVPPSCADMTVSHNSRVFVKFNDNEFYPLYFVYYKRRPEHLTKSKYYRANNHRVQSQLLWEHFMGVMDLSAESHRE